MKVDWKEELTKKKFIEGVKKYNKMRDKYSKEIYNSDKVRKCNVFERACLMIKEGFTWEFTGVIRKIK